MGGGGGVEDWREGFKDACHFSANIIFDFDSSTMEGYIKKKSKRLGYNYKLFMWKTSLIGRKLYTFFNRKWLFDKIYNEYVSQNILDFGYHFTYQSIDRGLIESLGPFGLSNVF